MNFRFFFILPIIFLLNNCETVNQKEIKNDFNQKYMNRGFALIYSDNLKKDKKITKKINNRSLLIFHKTLKKKSYVKITNPFNNKSVIAEVVSNKVDFSDFYNSVITNRIADELSLNIKEPYIELILISKESTFVVKKAIIFDEEKEVAQKAPVEDIKIDNLGKKTKENTVTTKNEFLYSIKVADFYYKDSAINMIDRIKNETNLKNYVLKKISKTKYRVLLGPFNDIKKLEESFNEMKLLDFENLEILKNV
jgi:hypothetical protein